eukprot:5735614-Prymnesium_polylepis.1
MGRGPDAVADVCAPQRAQRRRPAVGCGRGRLLRVGRCFLPPVRCASLVVGIARKRRRKEQLNNSELNIDESVDLQE